MPTTEVPIQPKSATDRATVSKVGEEVAVPGGQKVTVDEQLRNETLIISDIFQMNELDALELLLTGMHRLFGSRVIVVQENSKRGTSTD